MSLPCPCVQVFTKTAVFYIAEEEEVKEVKPVVPHIPNAEEYYCDVSSGIWIV